MIKINQNLYPTPLIKQKKGPKSKGKKRNQSQKKRQNSFNQNESHDEWYEFSSSLRIEQDKTDLIDFLNESEYFKDKGLMFSETSKDSNLIVVKSKITGKTVQILTIPHAIKLKNIIKSESDSEQKGHFIDISF